jgi:hypothetical protein
VTWPSIEAGASPPPSWRRAWDSVGPMVIAILEMTLPRGNEPPRPARCGPLLGFACALPGCIGGGAVQGSGPPRPRCTSRCGRSRPARGSPPPREYHRLLAIMETAAERPALRFNLPVRPGGSRGSNAASVPPERAVKATRRCGAMPTSCGGSSAALPDGPRRARCKDGAGARTSAPPVERVSRWRVGWGGRAAT